MRVKFFPEQCYLRVGMQMNHHFCASLLGKVANNYAKEGCCGLLRVTLNGPKRPSGSGQGCYPPAWPSRGPGWGFKSWARVRAAARSRNALLCIATSHPLIIWSRALWVGLIGLWERRRRSAFIEDACLSNCFGFWGVFSEEISLPLLLGGVGVLSWISSISITVRVK